jgi:hypothetical protein
VAEAGLVAEPLLDEPADGLEKVAGEKQFLDRGELHSIQDDSPIPGYAFPGIDDARVATGVAGFIGTVAEFALGYGLAYVLRRRRAGQGRWSPSATTR